MNQLNYEEENNVNICPWCENEVRLDDFVDSDSLKEFYITGVCLACKNDSNNWNRYGRR